MMSVSALQAQLLNLFARQGVELEADEDWLLTDGEFPALGAQWHPAQGEAPGWLDVDVVVGEDRQIELSFPGASLEQALQAFEQQALPVLLASCWYHTDERQLQLLSWEQGLHSWDVFVGTPGLSPAGISLPAGWLAALQQAVAEQAPSRELHWISLVQRRAGDGQISREVRLDNQAWSRGEQALAGLEWPAGTQAYVVRAFLALDIRDY